MKLSSHANKLLTNAEQQESHNFSIGDASVVIEILRNKLYEHPIRTLVQEYCCNGRDANREAKSTKPLLITAPTMLQPEFVVRDYGLGISPDRVANVFVKYGSSTKRNSDKMTGGFGIGAKSAWSYTDSFIVTTFINGTKRVYLCHTGLNSEGKMDLLSTTDGCGEENGTEIKIPVKGKDISAFNNAIVRAVFEWDKKDSYKVTNITSDRFEFNGTKYPICNGIEARDVSSYGRYLARAEAAIIIDGVQYNLDLREALPNSALVERLVDTIRFSLFITAGNGDVEVSASREKLSLSAKTLSFLKDKLTLINNTTQKMMRDLESTQDVGTLITKYNELNKFLFLEKRKTKTVEIYSDLLTFSDASYMTKIYTNKSSGRRGRFFSNTEIESTTEKQMTCETFVNNIYLDDIGNTESSVVKRRRIKNFILDGKGKRKIIAVLDNASHPLYSICPNVKKLSSLELPPKEIKDTVLAKVKEETDEDTLNYRRLGGSYIFSTSLKGINEVHIWVDYATEHSKFKHTDFHEVFRGKHFISLTKDMQLKIKGNKHFIKYEDWLRDYKPTNGMILQVLNINNSTNIEYVYMLKKFSGKLKSKAINELLDEPILKAKLEITSSVLTEKISLSDEYKDILKKVNTLKETLIDIKLPLLKSFDNNRLTKVEIEELTEYINMKLPK